MYLQVATDALNTLDSLSVWPLEVLENRSSRYVYYTYDMQATNLSIVYSVVDTFETLTSNLVGQENYTEERILTDNVDLEIKRVQ